jgi:hypothetical protein
MPSTYTRENFSPSDLPPGFNREAQKTICSAVDLGWKLLVTNRGHCTLIAPPPNDHVRINLSQRKDDGPMNRIQKKLLKYATPELVDEAEAKAHESAADPSLDPKALAEAERQRAEYLAAQEAEPEQAEAVYLVSEGPMLARKNTKQAYASQIATERHWSDGTTDYQCTLCDFTGTKPTSMGSHWRRHVLRGEADRVGPGGSQGPLVDIPEVEPAYTRTHTPREDRVAALARHLAVHLKSYDDLSSMDPDVLAERLASEALTWSHEQSSSKGLLAAEREPLTDAEMLDRIRTMLDNGLYLRQQQEIETLRREAAEAKAKTEALRSDLSGLAGLLDQYRDDRQEAKA